MKNDLPYFFHYHTTHNEPKIQALIAEFGMAGYGRYWILCEKIAASPDASLDISNRVIKLMIAKSLDLNSDDFEKFVDFLSADDIGLLDAKDGIITTDWIQESFSKVSKKREHNKENYKKTLSENSFQQSERIIQPSENIQSRAEKRRVDKSSSRADAAAYQKIFIGLGYDFDKDAIQSLCEGLSPEVLTSEYSYPEYIAAEVEKRDPDNRLGLFIHLFKADDRQAAYKDWRIEQISKASKAVIKSALEDPPRACGKCSNEMRRAGDDRLICSFCGQLYEFQNNAWKIIEEGAV